MLSRYSTWKQSAYFLSDQAAYLYYFCAARITVILNVDIDKKWELDASVVLSQENIVLTDSKKETKFSFALKIWGFQFYGWMV